MSTDDPKVKREKMRVENEIKNVSKNISKIKEKLSYKFEKKKKEEAKKNSVDEKTDSNDILILDKKEIFKYNLEEFRNNEIIIHRIISLYILSSTAAIAGIFYNEDYFLVDLILGIIGFILTIIITSLTIIYRDQYDNMLKYWDEEQKIDDKVRKELFILHRYGLSKCQKYFYYIFLIFAVAAWEWMLLSIIFL